MLTISDSEHPITLILSLFSFLSFFPTPPTIYRFALLGVKSESPLPETEQAILSLQLVFHR